MHIIIKKKDFRAQQLETPEKWLDGYNNLQFYRLFRMEQHTFQIFITIIERGDEKNILKKKYTGGYKPIDIKIQGLIFLWYMATQDSLVYIANRFNVCSATVMNIINKMLYFVIKLKKAYIKFPKTEEDMLEISRGFTTYPGV